MPLYVYECSACKKEIEELQKFDDPVPSTCPHCQAKGTLQRKLGVSNFQLKGGGWASEGYS